jgi:hypothetical protein
MIMRTPISLHASTVVCHLLVAIKNIIDTRSPAIIVTPHKQENFSGRWTRKHIYESYISTLDMESQMIYP